MSSLRFILLLTLLTLKKLHAIHYYDYEAIDNKHMEMLTAKEQESVKDISVVERCTRRFAPGTCVDPVASVWTFSLEKKACIERLGCRSASTMNRFPSRHRCMDTCLRLVVAYERLVLGRPLDYDNEHEGAIKLIMELRQGKPSDEEPSDEDYIRQYSELYSQLDEGTVEDKDWLPQSILDGDGLESDVDFA